MGVLLVGSAGSSRPAMTEMQAIEGLSVYLLYMGVSKHWRLHFGVLMRGTPILAVHIGCP